MQHSLSQTNDDTVTPPSRDTPQVSLGGTAAISVAIDNEELRRCAELLAQDFLPPGWRRVHSSAYTKVAYSGRLELYYKQFLSHNRLEHIKAMFRGSRATRAKHNSDALLYMGFDAPATICQGTLPQGDEYLFTQACPGHTLTEWLQVRAPLHQTVHRPRRRELLFHLGTFIGRMHAAGFVHGDLRPGNILAAQHDGGFRFTLLDNERNSQKVPPPGRRVLRNLMQLNMLPLKHLSRRERLLFFRAWRRQVRELSVIEANILAREAYGWAMRRMVEKKEAEK